MSSLQASAPTPLDARDTDHNSTIWNARLVLATGLHLAPLQESSYAEVFIYDEAPQESALSDVAILDALPRNCLLMRLADVARKVGRASDHLALGIRSVRLPCLEKNHSNAQSLVIDDLPPAPSVGGSHPLVLNLPVLSLALPLWRVPPYMPAACSGG